MIGERLHAVDQRDNAVGFVADQASELATGSVGILLQKLGRTAYPGQRVFDLMREHRGHCGNRPGGVAVGELAVDLVDDRPLVQGQNQLLAGVACERRLDRDNPAAKTRPVKRDIIFRHRVADPPDPLDQRQQRAMRGHQAGQGGTDKGGRPGAEELLGGGIDHADFTVAAKDDDRIGKGRQHRRRIGRRRLRPGCRAAPAEMPDHGPGSAVSAAVSARSRTRRGAGAANSGS